MENVPINVLRHSWSLHCFSLLQCTFEDSTIAEIIDNYVPLLSHVDIDHAAAGEGGSVNNLDDAGFTPFSLDLSKEEELCSMVLAAPNTILPVIEFTSSVLHWKKTKRLLHLQCCPTGLPSVSFDALGAHMLNKFVSVTGTIVRMTSARPVCIEMKFVCMNCRKEKVAPVDGILEYPTTCEGKCRGYRWSPDPSGAKCEEVQYLKIQEPPKDSRYSPSGSSGIGKIIEVELKGRLLDSVGPGEIVEISGIAATRRGERKFAGAYQFLIKARSVESMTVVQHTMQVCGSGGNSEWAQEDCELHYQGASQPGWFQETLVQSLCPSIYGQQDLKEALILSMIGGTPKQHMRPNIHLVMIGDPGLGKSQLLRAACQVAPRSVYVSANTSSSCGLTVTLSRDSSNGESIFEAGAVIHGDGGITCIDEIDKGSSEHKSLLEVMEQESISMAKAGMIFTMPIHTTILAAGNPCGGRFNASRSISDNVNMSLALLSRFDVVWLMKDKAGGVQDGHLTRHVLNVHRGETQVLPSQFSSSRGEQKERLLSPHEFAKFINFAREKCHPNLSHQAAHVLKQSYLEHRQRSSDFGSVTPRHLQSMIRIAEARAKVELRDMVTVNDAYYAVELLRKCNDSLAADGSGGQKNYPRAVASGGGKLNIRMVIAREIEHQLQITQRSTISHRALLEVCQDCGAKNPNAMVDQLNQYGIILQQSGNEYRLQGRKLQ